MPFDFWNFDLSRLRMNFAKKLFIKETSNVDLRNHNLVSAQTFLFAKKC